MDLLRIKSIKLGCDCPIAPVCGGAVMCVSAHFTHGPMKYSAKFVLLNMLGNGRCSRSAPRQETGCRMHLNVLHINTALWSPHIPIVQLETHHPSHHTRILLLLFSGLHAAAPEVIAASFPAAALTWWWWWPFLIILMLSCNLCVRYTFSCKPIL